MKLIHGDCREYLFTCEPDSIDLTVTSPPYDNLRTYNNSSTWGWAEFSTIAAGLWRVTKPGGVVVWVVNDKTENGSESGSSFEEALHFKKIGFNIHDTMIYEKQFYVPLTHNRFEQCFEYMFILSKGKPKTFNPIMVKTLFGGKKSTLTHRKTGEQPIKGTNYGKPRKDYRIDKNIRVYQPKRGEEHPAVYPDQLAIEMINCWSNEGDMVLDPMMGSGTTGKMAKLLNRNFIGIEIDKEYFEIAKHRIEGTQYNKSLEMDGQTAARHSA